MSDAAGGTDLLADLAAHLTTARGDSTAPEPIDLAKRAQLLRIARDVAHATERQNAPLAAYLIGRFVQAGVVAGMSETAALDQAAEVVQALIGEAAD
jgi:hypothetical protein